ncbi:MAG: cell division protein FtsZ [Flavobacteriales bacterium]|nr:cell division protein FtsZ [Flavobacteriales bacterium]
MNIFGEKLKFITPDKDTFNDIKVVGVGGGGGNTVSYMYAQRVPNVDFAICNTDRQALQASPVRQQVQLGSSTTEGLGAGSRPDKGADAARESMDAIKALFPDETKMVFITAGMGGGTGTGAGPIVARVAREMGKLTIGIVTRPFSFEGRDDVAEAGIREMREAVDSLIIIDNNKIFEGFGNVDFENCFSMVNEVLHNVASNIADVVNRVLTVNVDMNDMRTLLKDSHTAMLGTGSANGDDKAQQVIKQIFSSPFMSDVDVYDSTGFVFVIKYGKGGFVAQVMDDITKGIRAKVGPKPQAIKWGYGYDPDLADGEIKVIFVTSGFPEDTQKKKQTPQIVHVRVKEEIKPTDLPINGHSVSPFTSHMSVKQLRKETNGTETEYNVFTLNIKSDDMPRINFGKSISREQSYSFGSANEHLNTTGEELSPMESPVEDVFSSLSIGMHITPRGRDKMQSNAPKNTEPAYKRMGINITLNPDKEGRTNTYHL